MYRIEAPHFVAGVILENSICIKAAPIVSWMWNNSLHAITEYCKFKGWKIKEVK